MLRLALPRAVVISIYDIQRAVADKGTEWKTSNDEFGMTNGRNFGICVLHSHFALAHPRRTTARGRTPTVFHQSAQRLPRLVSPARIEATLGDWPIGFSQP